MLWTDDPTHPFAGIVEKLKRANENIGNLHGELVAFFEVSDYPLVPDVKSQEWQKAVDYHRSRTIPNRFSVLSGEIIHQMRSCLDHIAWHFSSPEYRIKGENAIEFPVFRKEPITKDEIGRYGRKVKGIADPKVISLIRAMQPYNRRSDPETDPVCIVHDMDRFDKHRELAIVVSCAAVIIPANAGREVALTMIKYSEGKTLNDAELALVRQVLKQNAIVAPQIAFAKFGERKNQFVVPGLLQLHEAIFERVDMFANLV
jgi:hypothetical protein